MEGHVLLGKVGAAHGLHGRVVVHPYTDPIEGLLDYPKWTLLWPETKKQVQVELEEGSPFKKGLLVRLKGIDAIEQAQDLTHAQIWVSRACLPELEEDEDYWCDLLGCTVQTQQGQDLGKLMALFDNGAHPVMRIGIEGRTLHLVPFVRPDIVVKTDIKARMIWVDWSPEAIDKA